MNRKKSHTSFTRQSSGIVIPIRAYFVLMNMVLLCLLFPTISLYFFQKTTTFRDAQLEKAVENRKADLEARAAHLVQTLAHSGTQAISGYNFTFLNNLTREAVTSDPELISCHFIGKNAPEIAAAGYGPKGVDWYNTFSKRAAGINFKPILDNQPLPVVKKYTHSLNGEKKFPTFQAVAPVYVGDSLWGTVHAAFSLEILQKDVENLKEEWAGHMQQYKTSLFTITTIFFCLGIISTLLFTRPLIRSILSLRDGVEQVAGGDLSQKINLKNMFPCREFLSLSRSFNYMTDNLRYTKEQLDEYSRSLEDKVEERTRELKETQAELVSQAHEAGMAEMAVDVLHNIGNAITPTKVTTSMLVKRLRNSSLRTRLGKVLEKLPPAISTASNISEKEKEQLVKLIKLVPESIREEFDLMIDDVESINEKNEYIEEIIRLQMHYAKLPTAKDFVDVNKVTRDSLKMIKDLITKYEISVETNYSEVPQVRFEQSKLLQILLNLIKNGCEAMFENEQTEKKLSITIFQDDTDSSKVIISVKDTGRGFTREEKNKLFTFGYSTRKGGSGFGLHSCANYLIANDGTIEAKSDGPGQGAEFIVTLPAADNS